MASKPPKGKSLAELKPKLAKLWVGICFYTGLSYADIIALKWHQIHKDEHASKYIFNKRKKTSTANPTFSSLNFP